ncbi:MAG TPA: glycerol kinase GlpK [Aggregatilineaceae bacterium]|nr:glycerol kinase GlpK [Aggregatilineaceae bacterium]
MSAILAVDQSTSATKALLFSTTGELINKVAVEHQQIYPQPGWVEHDAEEIYRNTIKAIGMLLVKHEALKDELLWLSITNQRETIVVFDKKTGKPLHHAIVWQCRRGDAICQDLIKQGYSEQVQQSTGLKIDTYFPAAKLKWLFQNHPEIHREVVEGRALIGTIDAYLIYRLTKGQTFASDHSNACRTLLYDIGKLGWDETLGAVFDVPVYALPDVRESAAQYGETTLEDLLDHPLPICGVMGDSQAALFAERCFATGSGKVTFGTGSSVLLNIGEQFKLSPNGIVTTIGWRYCGKTTYAFEGIINFTGATVAWLRDQLRLIDTPQETEALALAVPDNGNVYLVPAFVGLSAPYWRADAHGAVVGLTPASTKEHVVRAALEAIAYQIRDVLGLMAQDAGVTLQHVHGDGGMVNNKFLMQFVADIVRYTVRASSLPELSALGAVLFGALGQGVYHSLNDLEGLPLGFVDYDPQMDAAQAEIYYAGWQKAVQQVL